jgi:hypothetical protein
LLEGLEKIFSQYMICGTIGAILGKKDKTSYNSWVFAYNLTAMRRSSWPSQALGAYKAT